MRFLQIILLIFIVTIFVDCKTFVQVDKVKNMKEDFIPKIGNSKTIGIVALENKKLSNAEYGNYVSGMEFGAKDGLMQNKYFSVQDLLDRNEFDRLFAKKQYDSIQKKFSIGVLYEMETTPIKNILCNLTSETRYRQGNCIRWSTPDKNGISTCQQYQQIPYQVNISNITFQFQINGKLINLKNGNTIQMSSSPDFMIAKDGTLCSNDNSGLKHFFREAAFIQSKKLAMVMSPITEAMAVELHKGPEGIPDQKENDSIRSQVESLLSKGIDDYKEKRFDEAENKFLEAYKISNQKSASAAWNLGVFAWKKMDLISAVKYFGEALSAEIKWKTPEKIRIYSEAQEQIRILKPEKKK